MRRLLTPGLLSLALPSALAGQPAQRDPVLETARALAVTAVERVNEQSQSPHALEGVWLAERSAEGRLRQFGAAAVPLLREAMSSPDSSHVTRTASAFALASLDPAQADTAAAVLVGQIHAMGFSSQQFAPALLVALGSRAVPALVRHVDDPAVIDVLASMRDDARGAVPALIGLAERGNVQAAAALVAIGDPQGVAAARPVLVRALDDESWQTVQIALSALGRLGVEGRDLILRIGDFLDHPVAEIRMASAIALADIGATGLAVPALERLVMDTTVHSRYTALRKLAAMGPQARAAADGLLRVVRDEQREPGERAAAAGALGRIVPRGTQYRAAWLVVATDAELRRLAEAEGARPPTP